MSPSGIDPQSVPDIRRRLMHQAQVSQSADQTTLIDWSMPQVTTVEAARAAPTPPMAVSPAAISPHAMPREAGAGQTQRLSDAVNTLKQRSMQAYQAVYPSQDTGQRPPSVALTDIARSRQQLAAMADRINQLSQQQVQAMVNLQAAQAQLQVTYAQGPTETRDGANFSPPLPQIDFTQAVVAQALQDEAGNIGLSYQTVDLLSPEADARQLAQALRQRQGHRRRPERLSTTRRFKREISLTLATVLQEPLAMIRPLWSHLMTAGEDQTMHSVAPPSRGSTGSTFESLTLIDAVIWLGSGVIGRLSLDLILAAIPGLWSVAVALITAITAFALYRATLAPKLDFGLAYRVFLVIGGLILGGRF